MSEPQTTFKSALWNHAGKILEYLLMYFTSVLIARGLGVQENGTFVGLFSVSQLLLVLTSFGLEVSLNKHIPQLSGELRSGNIRYILRWALGVRIVVILSVATALYVVQYFSTRLFPPLFSEFMWCLVAYTGVRSIVSLFAVVLTAELQTRLTSVINVLTRSLEVVLIGFMAAGQMTPMSVFLVFLSTATLQLAAYVVVANIHFVGRVQQIAVLPIIMFGGIYWTNTAVEYFLGRQGDVLFLTMLLPDTTQASLYDVAFAVSQLASLSMTIGLGGITLATSAKLALRGPELLERFYGFMIRMTSLLSIPLYAFILFNAGSVLLVIYSSRYLAAAGLIQGIAAFRIAGRLFGGPENAEFLLSRSQVSKLVVLGIAGAVVNVGLNLLLIPTLGATGAVIASGFGNLTVNILAALAVYRMSLARMQWRFWLKVTLATCSASLLCSFLIPPNNLFFVGVQALIYALCTLFFLFLLKPITGPDLDWLMRINERLSIPLKYFVENSSHKGNV